MTLQTWTALRWPQFTVVILASGHSLSAAQCAQVKSWREAGDTRRVIAINTTYQRAPWADVLYACDWQWWQAYADKVTEEVTGELWTQDERAANNWQRVKLIRSSRNPGLSRQPGVINQGGNSGYQAIGLAQQAGAKRILLLGYDMHGTHWHGEHPPGLEKRQNFKDWIRNFEVLAADLITVGVEVINCTTGSALTCFRSAALNEVLHEHSCVPHPVALVEGQ